MEAMLCPYGEIDFNENPKPIVKIRQWYKCPKCGQPLSLQPSMRNIKMAGSINLKCSFKIGKRVCNGVLTIKPKE